VPPAPAVSVCGGGGVMRSRLAARHRRLVDRLDADAVAVDRYARRSFAVYGISHDDRHDVAGVIEMRPAQA